MSELYAGSPVVALGEGPARLAAGQLGVVVARPGTGKTTLLVHLALDALLRGRGVLHVALLDTVDHARAHYDEVVRAIADRTRLADASLRVERHRMIHSFHGRRFEVAGVRRNLAILEDAASFSPEVLVVDGYSGWDAVVADLEALRALALERGVVVWLSVRASSVAPPEVSAVARRVLLLEPSGPIGLVPRPPYPTSEQRVAQAPPSGPRVRLVSAPAQPGDLPIDVVLDPGTLLTSGGEGGAPEPPRLVGASECTLYSGGAFGAEVAFGEAAERAGVHEVSFTFEGHLQVRSRGRYELSPKELAMGDVSLAYVSKRLNRSYKSDAGGLIRGVLQTLWHMVSRSQQVFVVGTIQEDGTVVGGTGWSVELARTWQRELWVFDQPRRAWFRWDGAAWVPGTPSITAAHVCGTGTRYLDDHGRFAIDELFARSFGS